MKHLVIFLILLLLFLSLNALVSGDVLHLKGGRKIEGKITEEKENAITIKTRCGCVTFPRRDVIRIEKCPTRLEVFTRRFRTLKKNSNERDFVELAKWCENQKLRKEYKEVLGAIRKRYPGNAFANKSLGLVEFRGEWVTPAKKVSLEKQRHLAEMNNKGLVEYKGKWILREDREALEKGLVKYKGKWMTPDEEKEAQGFVKYKGKYVPPEDLQVYKLQELLNKKCALKTHCVCGQNADVLAEHSKKYAEDVSSLLDKVGNVMAEIFHKKTLFPETKREGSWARTKPFILIVEDLQQHKCCARVLTEEGLLLKRYLKGILAKGDYYTFHRPPAVVMYPREGDTPADLAAKAIHLFVKNALYIPFPRWNPPWLVEGIAHYFELEYAGRIGCRTATHTLVEDLQVQRMQSVLKEGFVDSTLPNFKEMVACSWDQLHLPHVVQATCLVHYLMNKDKGQFGLWLSSLSKVSNRLQDLPLDGWLPFYDRTLKETFGMSLDDLQKRWAVHAENEGFPFCSLVAQEK